MTHSTRKELKDVSASVSQRLSSLAKKTNRRFDELLQYYAMERFLYRLSQSEYSDRVILKGALMFVVWNAPRSRATRDIDLLGRLENKVDGLVAVVKNICQTAVGQDGLTFDPTSIKGERIKEDADYKGVRTRFVGRLGQAKVFMQIDFGFGDTIYPKPVNIDYPSLLGMPHPQLKGYPRETVVAEKFQAMVDLEILNSRMKDFYDIWLLANQFDFDGQILRKSITETFAKRDTKMTNNPVALSDKFALNEEKNIQWKAFIRKNSLEHAPKDLREVIEVIKRFLLPVVTPTDSKKYGTLLWNAPGPWIDKRSP